MLDSAITHVGRFHGSMLIFNQVLHRYESSAPGIILLLSSAIDSSIQGSLNAVNQVGIISGTSVLDVHDGARLLVDLLGKVCLGHLCSQASVLN